MPLDDFISGADIADAARAGWRYLFSHDYRLKKRDEWRTDGWLWMLLEVTFGTLGILLSMALVALAGYAVWTFI